MARPRVVLRRLADGDGIGPRQRMKTRAHPVEFARHGSQPLLRRREQPAEVAVVTTQTAREVVEPRLSLSAEDQRERRTGGQPIEQAMVHLRSSVEVTGGEGAQESRRPAWQKMRLSSSIR